MLHRSMKVLLVALFLPMIVQAQTGMVAGTVTDSKTGEALAGANVIIEGTTLGAAADMNGSFLITDIPPGSYTVTASMIGNESASQDISVIAGEELVLDFELEPTILQLSAVTVRGNFAIERETPVAFTTIGEEHIRNNFTVQDVPHLFANTPGVYVMSDGGSGMGDSKVLIRGFDEQRIAVMINNVPVNDPESKKVYWSNWGSLPAASQSIQIQRGVGSSLYGSGALGGSINVITKDAPADKSLSVTMTAGQYGIFKGGIDYNSGLLGGNKSFIARFNYLEGNGWRQDTFYRGIQYYLAGMFFPNERNTFKVILHGAPQYHAYAYMGFWPQDKYGVGYANYGKDWNGHPHVAESELKGTNYDGRGTTLMDVILNRTEIGVSPDKQVGGLVIGNDRASLDNNVYHKPQFEIHHSMQINETSRLTSTFFMSRGYGYGENLNGYYKVARDANSGNMSWAGIDTAGQYQYRNYSSHFQTGLLSSYETKMGDHDLTAGFEARYWNAQHAGEILNTFDDSDGLISYYIGNVKHKFAASDLYYDYDGIKPQITGFGHALWRFGPLSVMTDVQFSTMKYNIVERIPDSGNYPGVTTFKDKDGKDVSKGTKTWNGTGNTGSSDTTYTLFDYEKSFSFVSPKIGVNYNVNSALNVFANFSQAVNEPRVKFFFAYGSPNDALKLERTNDIELGAGYRADIAGIALDTKLNLYYIAFTGKALRITDPTKANTQGYDYKGRRYIPIGGSTYSGVELAVNAGLPFGLDLGINISNASNLWGEPDDSEGAQYLYSSAAVVAGVDYTDSDGDGYWDAGEAKLHSKFVDKFDERVEIGMPQLIIGSTLNWSSGPVSLGLAMRRYADLYVMENNEKVLVADKDEDIFGDYTDNSSTAAADRVDTWSATLPSATVLDVTMRYNLDFLQGVDLSVHINNVLDATYWQKGDSYGVGPGAARTIIANLTVTL